MLIRIYKDILKALQSYDKALELNPYYVYAWSSKGNALSNLGRYKEAIDCYDSSFEVRSKIYRCLV